MSDTETRTAEAGKIVKKYALGALGVGIVPIPFVDMAALAGIQLKMLHSLAGTYDLEFSEHMGKSLIGSLLSGGIPLSLSANLSRWLKNVPPYGLIAGMIGVSLFGSASTYAMGKVFVQHFESGGTFLSFDPDQVRDYYEQQFEKGKAGIRENFVGIKP